MNLHKHVWTEALLMDDFKGEGERNNDRLQKLVSLAEGYEKRVKEETELTKDQLKTRYVGKVDPKKREYRHIRGSVHLLINNHRHRGRWPAADRGQHRVRFTANDRQGGVSAQVELATERKHGRRRRRHGGVDFAPRDSGHSPEDQGVASTASCTVASRVRKRHRRHWRTAYGKISACVKEACHRVMPQHEIMKHHTTSFRVENMRVSFRPILSCHKLYLQL